MKLVKKSWEHPSYSDFNDKSHEKASYSSLNPKSAINLSKCFVITITNTFASKEEGYKEEEVIY